MQRSTEELTRCSTATLEENPENTDGVRTETVSEKIMSICKNTIRWVLFLDALLALSVLILLVVLEFGTLPQQRIGFFCNDPKISFKFAGDTVSITLLLAITIATPVAVMWVAECIFYPTASYNTALGCAGSRAKQVWSWYGHYSIGIISLVFICDVMKTVVGEPRPHFLDTCKPREARNCTDSTEYVERYTCTNTIDSQWFVSDSSKSFPSGHSALSMYTSVFIVWYLQNRLPDRTIFLKPWLQCVTCLWTVICSLTRIGDHRHHWWDVLVGDFIGFAFGTLTVMVACRKFSLNHQNIQQIYNEPIENGQISFDKRQSAKKLLHETTVEVSESRELKNIPTTWKE